MTMSTRGARIGIDVGGTFTDLILQEAGGRVSLRKVLSSPPAYDRAVVESVSALSGSAGQVESVVHGTTVATNAVLERRGARTFGMSNIPALYAAKDRELAEIREMTGTTHT